MIMTRSNNMTLYLNLLICLWLLFSAVLVTVSKLIILVKIRFFTTCLPIYITKHRNHFRYIQLKEFLVNM